MGQKLTKYIIVYDKDGRLVGFYDDLAVAVSVVNTSENFRYSFINDQMHSYLLNLAFTPDDPIINLSKITDCRIVIDNTDFFLPVKSKPIDLDKVRRQLIRSQKAACKAHITAGLAIPLSTGETKEFSFEIEDQINLKELLAHHRPGDQIPYHAKEETLAEYSYDDLETVYRELYNNKIYNLIYTQVLCDYIAKSYTEEAYLNKEIITYGYTNDQISKEVDRLYAGQLLQC